MCLNLNFFNYSPLEQFEINSFNSSRFCSRWSFPLEIFENSFYQTVNFFQTYTLFDLILFVGIFKGFQVISKDLSGFIGFAIFLFILITNINVYGYGTDFVITLINFENNLNSFIYTTSYEYVNWAVPFINIYSISFCFIFIHFVIYVIYNKMLSNNTNTLFPTLYQILAENLYKISLNLFYSILGKHVTIPEFFIKINTIFIFLIISNIQGMIPYMSTLTSALTNTFFIALALFISIITTLLDKKGFAYFLNLFMPSGCPILLSLLIIPIEVISYSFRLVSLSVRLFANMMAGHTLLKVIVGFSWVIIFLGNTFLINLFPILILFILTLLEFGVALIQAYIFTVLSCIYLRDIFEGH